MSVRWTVWAPAGVSVLGGLVALLAWAFGVAVLEQRVATVEREQQSGADALWRRLLERNVPAGFRP